MSKVFLATVGKRDTRSFRLSCMLKEDIDPEILQEAVTSAIEDRPQMQVRIRRGIFWHYMEDTDLVPSVKQEEDRICPLLYVPSKTMLHYQVTYFGRRINLDISHVLADGRLTHREKVSIYYGEDGIRMIEEKHLADGYTVENGKIRLTVDTQMCDGNFTEVVYTLTALTEDAKKHIRSLDIYHKRIYADTGVYSF